MVKKQLFYVLSLVSSFVFSQENVREVGALPDALSESSGLLFFNGKIITHNDSGNTAQLFEIDTLSLVVTRAITVTNAQNVDWEDISQDENHIYIGDFGNNNGNRTDLTIYKILKSAYLTSESVTAERINFVYEDQVDFERDPNNNDWDAEALFVLNDELIILTKQWQSGGTVAYSVPKTPGSHSAKNLGSYAVNGLVTGATYNPETETLFLIGYSRSLAGFLTKVEGVTQTSIFGGTVARTNLDIGFAQVEGITFINHTTYYFSSERFTRANPPISSASRLFSFKVNVPIEEEAEEEEENPGEENPEDGSLEELILHRGVGSSVLHYELNTNKEVFGRAIFDLSGRQITKNAGSDISSNSIDVSTLQKSVYYLTFYLQGKIISKPFILN